MKRKAEINDEEEEQGEGGNGRDEGSSEGRIGERKMELRRKLNMSKSEYASRNKVKHVLIPYSRRPRVSPGDRVTSSSLPYDRQGNTSNVVLDRQDGIVQGYRNPLFGGGGEDFNSGEDSREDRDED